MSSTNRGSQLNRSVHDNYPTPPWVYEAMSPHLFTLYGQGLRALEPAAGDGRIVRFLAPHFHSVDTVEIRPEERDTLEEDGIKGQTKYRIPKQERRLTVQNVAVSA